MTGSVVPVLLGPADLRRLAARCDIKIQPAVEGGKSLADVFTAPCPKCGRPAEVTATADGRSVNVRCRGCGFFSLGVGETSAAWEAKARAARGNASRPAGSKSLELVRLSYAEMLSSQDPEIVPVVSDIGERGLLTFLFSAPGGFKTWLAMETARCVATGRPFLGLFPCAKAPVVVLDGENHPRKVRERLQALESGAPLPSDAEEIIFVPPQGLALERQAHRKAVRALLETVRPGLAIVDTIGSLTCTDLTSQEKVAAWLPEVRVWAIQLEICFLVLAHIPKDVSGLPDLRHLFGSVSLGGAADYAFATQDLETQPPSFRLACRKAKWGESKTDLHVTLSPGEGDGLILTAAERKVCVADMVLDLTTAQDWIPHRELSAEIEDATGGISRQAINAALRELLRQGRIEARTGPGKGGPREFRRRPE